MDSQKIIIGYSTILNKDTKEFVERYTKPMNVECVEIHTSGINSESELIEALKGFRGIIAGGAERFTREVLAGLRDTLKIVCRNGAGSDNIDGAAAKELGIAVGVTPGGNAAAVAEMAVSLMHALARSLCLFDSEMRRGIWNQPRMGVQITGKTVGIIGFGRIGRLLAGYLKPFGCKLLAYDDYVEDAVLFEHDAQRRGLYEIAQESDFISLHAPYTPQTSKLIGSEFFAMMKKSSYLINTSRGGLIDQSALIAALEKGEFAGAALDVFESEPLSAESSLLRLNNVILTPHVSFNTPEALELTTKMAIDNIRNYLLTGKCEGIVNGM